MPAKPQRTSSGKGQTCNPDEEGPSYYDPGGYNSVKELLIDRVDKLAEKEYYMNPQQIPVLKNCIERMPDDLRSLHKCALLSLVKIPSCSIQQASDDFNDETIPADIDGYPQKSENNIAAKVVIPDPVASSLPETCKSSQASDDGELTPDDLIALSLASRSQEEPPSSMQASEVEEENNGDDGFQKIEFRNTRKNTKQKARLEERKTRSDELAAKLTMLKRNEMENFIAAQQRKPGEPPPAPRKARPPPPPIHRRNEQEYRNGLRQVLRGYLEGEKIYDADLLNYLLILSKEDVLDRLCESLPKQLWDDPMVKRHVDGPSKGGQFFLNQTEKGVDLVSILKAIGKNLLQYDWKVLVEPYWYLWAHCFIRHCVLEYYFQTRIFQRRKKEMFPYLKNFFNHVYLYIDYCCLLIQFSNQIHHNPGFLFSPHHT